MPSRQDLLRLHGRARSLEEQVAGPIIAPDEMAQPMDKLVARLSENPDYVRAFAKAFPDEPRVTEDNLRKAIATYERTFVSPVTRFDSQMVARGGDPVCSCFHSSPTTGPMSHAAIDSMNSGCLMSARWCPWQ